MAIRLATLAACILLSVPNLAMANSVNSKALDLASQQNFDSALTLLSLQTRADKSTYEHRFLKVRILSWAGKYAEARTELSSLMATNPNNPDLQLVLGNLEYYQGNLDAAQTEYERVLTRFPNYADAQNGLENIRKARQSKIGNGKKIWRLDGGIGFSDFDDSELPEWNDQFLRLEYAPHKLSYHASLQRYRRFGQTEVQVQAGISDAVRGGWDWGLELGFTPGGEFRPETSIGGRLGRTVKTNNGFALYPNISYRYDNYSAGGIQTIQPDLTAYLDNGAVLTGRLIATLQGNEEDQIGWLVEGRKSVINGLQIRTGYAQAPEAINGIAITTKSLFGGLTYTVSDDLDLHLNLSRDDREDSFIRKSANVGFTYKR